MTGGEEHSRAAGRRAPGGGRSVSAWKGARSTDGIRARVPCPFPAMLLAVPFRRILLADDDRALAALVSTALREEGFEVEHVTTGLQAVQSFERAPPDVVILDVLMPEMDGLEVCRKLRRRSRVPIVLLTSRGEEVDRVTGLETGADDYVTKPFSLRELCARIRALERRASGPGPEEGEGEAISAGDLTVDLGRFEVRWKGAQASLTRS